MTNDNIIQFLQKYQKISQALNIDEDVRQFDEIINFVKNNNVKDAAEFNTVLKKKYGEKDFEELISNTEAHLQDYDINSEIIYNKENIADFWNSLDVNKKEEFTIFELNVMLFLISNQYNKYMKKDKKRIIAFLNDAVKSKRMEKSYKDIHV